MDPGPRTCHSGPLPLRYTLRPLNPLLKSTKMVAEDGSGRSQRGGECDQNTWQENFKELIKMYLREWRDGAVVTSTC